MESTATHGILGRTGIRVLRLGLSGTYWPGKRAISRAAEDGVNFFFSFGFDRQMTSALRDLFGSGREKYVLATGAYNYIWGHSNIRRSLERRLRQFRTDYVDLFLFLGVMKGREITHRVTEDLLRIREDGRARFIGVSTHDRRLAGRLAQAGEMDVLMIRYNAAHRGAEQEIFPFLHHHDPGIIGYTATRWTYLLRRPRGYPKDGQIPTAGMAYRFVLSNPHIDVCLTAPRSERELKENLRALREGPLSEAEMEFMKTFGDRVHKAKKWFM